MSLIVGLTGLTGAGKTTACEIFYDVGFGIINCDRIARDVTKKGSDCLLSLTKAFTLEILADDGTLCRKKLGEIVFSNSDSLLKLNEITHPYIIEEVSRQISLLRKTHLVIVIDAPTLFESGANKLCDKIVSIIADETILLSRIMMRDNITKEQAISRLSSQHSADFFKVHSDYIAQNNNGKDCFEKQLNDIVSRLKEDANGN